MFKTVFLIVMTIIAIVGVSGCSTPPRATTETVPVVIPYEDSPFGFHSAYVAGSGYRYARDIGIRWDRPSLYVFWFRVQADLNRQEYDWSDYDQQFGQLPEDMHIMANIAAVPTALLADRQPPAAALLPGERLMQEREQARQYIWEGSYLPRDEESYLAFVRACVERYDGDGIDDMAGLTNPIRYWQVDNEPPHGLQDYAEFLKITYQAIKDADHEAKVVIGGTTGMPPVSDYLSNFNHNFLPILEELTGFEGQYFDIFDIHWYGNATGDYRGLGEVYSYITRKLDTLGLSPPGGYWITEMGTYSGKPIEKNYSFQDERQQAQDIIKRYVYPLSLGIKKVFLAFGLVEGFHHSDGYFDHTGLVYDGRGSNDLGPGVRKLSYYTYRKMVEELEGSNLDNIQVIHEQDGIYIYEFTRQGKPVWVAWNESDEPKTVRITLTGDIEKVRISEAVPGYEKGREVTDYSEVFNELQGRFISGEPTQFEFELGASPVFVEGDVQGQSVTEASAQGEVSSVEFLKKIEILNAARPEIIATSDRVFIVYLGNISRTESKTFSIKIFNSDLSQEIATKDMVYFPTEYGGPTDIRVASDGEYLYAFYETASLITKKAFLWGAKYTLDDGFKRVAFSGPVASSLTFDVATKGDEKLDDPIVLLGENSVFTITRYQSSLEKSAETKYKVYEYDKDLTLIREFDLNLSSVADGSARQASALYHDGFFYMAIPTTVGPAGPIANITPSDIVVVKFDNNWNIKESRIISTDNGDPDDAETYVTGFQADRNNFYLTYLQINIPKINTEFTAPLKVYDSNFNLILNEIVKTKNPDESGCRPSLEVTGERIFVGHSAGKQGDGNAEIYLYKTIREDEL